MRFFLLWGFLVWLGASFIFRFLGQVFFIPDNAILIVSSYIFVVPLILVLTFPIYKLKKIQENEDRIKAAVFIALPGMLIDSIVLIYFDQVFTNLSVETDRFFASWLMWAYALILFTGFYNKKNKRV